MSRQSHKATERIKKIASMSESEAKEYLRSEKRVEPEEASAGSSAWRGSALADAQKLEKAIALLERLERECLVPDFAHDAFGSCPVCRLIAELKAPNGESSESARK